MTTPRKSTTRLQQVQGLRRGWKVIGRKLDDLESLATGIGALRTWAEYTEELRDDATAFLRQIAELAQESTATGEGRT